MRTLFRWIDRVLRAGRASARACRLLGSGRPGRRAWMDAPLDGMVLPLAPYEDRGPRQRSERCVEIGISMSMVR